MRFSSFIPAIVALLPALAEATNKYVFAHVVVGDTAAHTVATWTSDIQSAKAAGIDAFALNIASQDPNSAIQVANAFSAAQSAGSTFKLFFSFDYAASPNGVFPPGTSGAKDTASVIGYINTYKSSSAYFIYNNLPFVSTFEGPSSASEWAPGGLIRGGTGGVYFVPSWNSAGTAGLTSNIANVDGFFSWDAWPVGAANKTTDDDKSWQAALNGKSYMMAVSPFFFHSASGGDDWVWRGDSLWADRWAQTVQVAPQFVEIVTWNDYGEAHYIGPLPAASEIPAGSAQFVNNMPHDSLRDFLPYYIAAYKGTSFTITKDQVQYWYRTAPAAAGSTCGVTGNTASQGQTELAPSAILEDGVFFSAILTSAATVTVQIGGGAKVSFAGVQGINHWSIPFNGATGAPSFAVVRNGATSSSGTGLASITSGTTLSSGCANYNFFVGSF